MICFNKQRITTKIKIKNGNLNAGKNEIMKDKHQGEKHT
jgi:hypothetical protein